MTYAEALRQRQIVLEHLRGVYHVGYAMDDEAYFEAELAELDLIVNTLWLERMFAWQS